MFLKSIMQLISMILILALTSCRSVDTSKIRMITRCMVQVKYNTCRCHIFDFYLGKRISTSVDYDIEKCDRFIAVSPSDYGKLSKVMIKLRSIESRK